MPGSKTATAAASKRRAVQERERSESPPLPAEKARVRPWRPEINKQYPFNEDVIITWGPDDWPDNIIDPVREAAIEPYSPDDYKNTVFMHERKPGDDYARLSSLAKKTAEARGTLHTYRGAPGWVEGAPVPNESELWIMGKRDWDDYSLYKGRRNPAGRLIPAGPEPKTSKSVRSGKVGKVSKVSKASGRKK